jgi:bis(5'-nucleosidyl)-tetraphosphatase
MPETDLIVSCGVLVFRRQPAVEFLLLRHSDRWDLPKGHVDAGESETTCALRELAEETGILPADIRLEPERRYVQEYWVRQKRHGPEPRRKHLIIFPGWLLRDCPIRLTEHLDHRWFPWKPPHQIQAQTIDPLLAAATGWLAGRA